MKTQDKEIDKVKSEEGSELSSKIGSILSYVLIFAIIVGVYLGMGDGPRVVGGYGMFNVLTRSMQSTIPKDSFVITKSVDPKSIQIGDDITFMAGPTSTITHRVIGIEEDYQRTGMRAFSTQGTDNATKDKDMVVETNVVGKVMWHNYHLGVATVFLQQNCYYIIAYLVMFILIKKIILKFMGDDEDEEEEDEEEPPSNLAGNSQYDTALWDASTLYEQPQAYDPVTGTYRNTEAYSYDAYGNPIPYQPTTDPNYGYGQQYGAYGQQYDAYGQPIPYNNQGYGYTEQDQNQQW